MSDVTLRRRGQLSRASSTEALEYRLIYSACFMAFLITFSLRRLAGNDEQADPRPSVLSQARSAAHATTGYAFMG